MDHTITVDAGLKVADVKKELLYEIETSWREKYGAELPLPRNEKGHRQLTLRWAHWLGAVARCYKQASKQARQARPNWAEIRLETDWLMPGQRPQPRRQDFALEL